MVARLFRDRLTERDLTEGAFEPPEFRYGVPGQDHGRDLRADLRGICPLVCPFALLFLPCHCTPQPSTSTCPSTRRAAPSSRPAAALCWVPIWRLLHVLCESLLKEQYCRLGRLVPTVGALVGWVFVSAYLHMNMTASIEIAVSADDSARSPPAFDQHGSANRH